MSEQQFEEHMNEVYMRDNKKPLKQNVLQQLPRSVFSKRNAEGAE